MEPRQDWPAFRHAPVVQSEHANTPTAQLVVPAAAPEPPPAGWTTNTPKASLVTLRGAPATTGIEQLGEVEPGTLLASVDKHLTVVGWEPARADLLNSGRSPVPVEAAVPANHVAELFT